ncbi:MAG: hypothetical protein ABSD57_11050 [Verrucomicrobiota bacterium]|jgi:hypothetical protein
MTLVVIQGLLQAILAYIAFHVTVHPVKKERDRVKIIGLKIVIVTCCLGAVFVSGLQYHDSERAESRNFETIKNLTNQLATVQTIVSADKTKIEEQSSIIHDLTIALNTNQSMDSATRLAILDKEDQKIIEALKAIGGKKEPDVQIVVEGNETTNRHEPVSVGVTGLKTLRAEWGNRHELWQLQKKQTELQSQRLEIEREQSAQQEALEKAKRARQEALEKAQQEALDNEQKQLAQQEVLRREKHITDQCLSVFNYVITTLYTTLVGVAKDTGDKVTFDFSSIPSVYESSFVSGGRIVGGTNSIRLGTNSAWNFEISATRLT